MESMKNYPVKVFATGIVVLVLFSQPLFWGRFFCRGFLDIIMPRPAKSIEIKPSRLVPPELENDPNVEKHSYIYSYMNTEEITFTNLGVLDYFAARIPKGRLSDVYGLELGGNSFCLYFDDRTGLIVYCRLVRQDIPGKGVWSKKVNFYIGPEGISETPDKSLGRFIEPVMGGEWMLYDRKLRRFFNINFREKTVVKGPELEKEDLHKPVQIGHSDKSQYLRLHWSAPQIKAADEEIKKRGYIRARPDMLRPIVERSYGHNAGEYLLVFDTSGRIDLLDKETLEFSGIAGYLPAPETFYPSKETVTPRDLLGYKAELLTFQTDNEYRGMYVASVSRDGTSMAAAVYDENGRHIVTDYTRAGKYNKYTAYLRDKEPEVRSSRTFFFGAPLAPVVTTGTYLLENLQPLVFGIISYFTASNFEASCGYRALFILPNSFIGMLGREVSDDVASRIVVALFLLLPSIILGLFVAQRICKDATAVGLSENAKLCWIVGAIGFGLSAYISYRLTRPTITLVSCPNCGKLRRPDMDKCHRCGSGWVVAEMIPPRWRVINGGSDVQENIE